MTGQPQRIHNSHQGGYDGLPLPLEAELERLIFVYEGYPGIAGDLRDAIADMQARAVEEGAA